LIHGFQAARTCGTVRKNGDAFGGSNTMESKGLAGGFGGGFRRGKGFNNKQGRGRGKGKNMLRLPAPEDEGNGPPPPPTYEEERGRQGASYEAAKKVADFPGFINSFISGGFRTQCVMGTCWQGVECLSRAEDKRGGGSGKAKQIPIYSGPDKEYHCAPCWEELIAFSRAQKRTAQNRRRRGQPPREEEAEGRAAMDAGWRAALEAEEEEYGKGKRSGYTFKGKGPDPDAMDAGAPTYTDESGTWQRLEGAPGYPGHAVLRPAAGGYLLVAAPTDGSAPGPRQIFQDTQALREQERRFIGESIRQALSLSPANRLIFPKQRGSPAGAPWGWYHDREPPGSKGNPIGGWVSNYEADKQARWGSNRSGWGAAEGRKRPRYNPEEWDAWRHGGDEDEEDQGDGWKKTRRGCRGGQKHKRR